MKLETERLIIRDLKKGDEISLRKNINNLNISKYLLTVPYPYTKKDSEWYYNYCLKNKKKKERDDYGLVITIKPLDKAVGGIGIAKIDKTQGTAELGYWISENNWRKGYVSEALKKIIDFCFYELKLRRLFVPVFVENNSSNALVKKLGFVYEGTLRKNCIAKSTGKIHDENIYGLLKEEWKNKK